MAQRKVRFRTRRQWWAFHSSPYFHNWKPIRRSQKRQA